MKTFTLHLPADAQPGDPDALERAQLVKDGFSWGAFFFTFLWFFYHRLWLAGVLVLVALLVAGWLFAALDVGRPSATLAQVLIQFLIGLEANSLRRWTLGRRGHPARDVLTAEDRDAAALKAFGRWLGAPTAPRATGRAIPPPAAAPYRGPDAVIGLFPDPEGRR
jgi:Protein of unknown function (DUF2628)